MCLLKSLHTYTDNKMKSLGNMMKTKDTDAKDDEDVVSEDLNVLSSSEGDFLLLSSGCLVLLSLLLLLLLLFG